MDVLNESQDARDDSIDTTTPSFDPTRQGVIAERYRIIREIGRGGMARVYLAHDLKHARDVAVKVIRAELAASLARERFLREIGIAASLRHPNIVPLYDSGDAHGVLFFVMPFEAGESLRDRLAHGGPLPVPEYVSVLRDVARALAYAHAQGVVHRDVKPDNVMLTGGAAVVTDFGIAKAVSVAQGASVSTTTLTQPGGGVGTPTYMAPEQAIGDPATDHRADLYAFGCLAYELITGAPPFHDLSPQQLFAAHLTTPPVPLQSVQPGTPDAMARVVMQCLAKDPADRPPSAQALLAAFDAPIAGVTSSHATHSRRTMALRVAGAVALCALGYAAWRVRLAGAGAEPSAITVAVLPMESIGGDSLQRELADGLGDEVATALVHAPGMRVMSRRGVGNYRGQQDLDYVRVGRDLGARYLVTGQLRLLEGKFTVGATLHDASDGAIVWKESYELQHSALDVMRDSIARGVVSALRTRRNLRTPDETLGTTRARPVAAEAYRLYILAQRALDRRGQSIEASVTNFERAIAIDSTYADAYAGLSLAYALRQYYSPISAAELEPRVRAAAAIAERLDPLLAAPHVAMGLAHQHAYRWDSAGAEFRTAIRLRSPADVEPLVQYGRHLMFRGRTADGLQQFLLARETEPASALVSSWVSYAFYVSGQLDSAMVESDRAYQSDTNNLSTLAFRSGILHKLGRRDDARRTAMRLVPLNLMGLYVLAAIGDTAITSARLAAAEAASPNRWLGHTQSAYVALGMRDTARALTELEAATDARESWPSWQSVLDPVFSGVFSSARYRTLLERVHLGDVTLPTSAPRR